MVVFFGNLDLGLDLDRSTVPVGTWREKRKRGLLLDGGLGEGKIGIVLSCTVSFLYNFWRYFDMVTD